MVAFCIGMSFVLTAVRELTGSLIPVAATRGMFNGIAPLLLILTPDAHPILAGPLGLLGTAILALLGAAAWTVARRRTGLGRTRRLSHRRAPRPPAAATRPAGGMDDSPVREAGAACRIPYHERRTSASSADGQKQRESRLEPAFEPLQFNWQGTEPRRRSRRLRTPVPY
jgi:hypothetical protein